MAGSENRRYCMDKITARSLEGNPLGSPVDREVAVYLPPDYFEGSERRYPTVYFLHGYSGSNRGFTVYPTLEANPTLPVELIPPTIREQIAEERLASYERFDGLIERGELSPMIFIQPDGSLQQPNIHGIRNITGELLPKGSFYVNSPYTGKYEDYILEVVRHVDANYRTEPHSSGRIIAGGSMGGYGALRLGLQHPEQFGAVAALSPGDLDPETRHLNHQLRIPIYESILGAETSAKLGDGLWEDILDTLDLIWSKDRPLRPTIERDKKGKVVAFDSQAAQNIQQSSLSKLIEKLSTQQLAQVRQQRIYLSCEKTDEFALADSANRLHRHLQDLEIPHHFHFFDDPQAKLSPHILGIAYEIIPALQYCLS